MLTLLKIFVILALLIALWPGHSYAYYELLKVSVFGSMAYFCFESAVAKRNGWAWVLGLGALVFNPFFSLRLTKDAWQILDAVAAVVLLASFPWRQVLPRICRRNLILGLSIVGMLCVGVLVLLFDVGQPTKQEMGPAIASPGPITECRQISYSFNEALANSRAQRRVSGAVYAYVQGGSRHYTSSPPKDVQCDAMPPTRPRTAS